MEGIIEDHSVSHGGEAGSETRLLDAMLTIYPESSAFYGICNAKDYILARFSTNL